ncbi:MAG: PorV/PorQ family protein [Ignavibacteria bacterium]|nr:MAG: PorV/PorQ family protein [Ignavibacteria bacterium]
MNSLRVLSVSLICVILLAGAVAVTRAGDRSGTVSGQFLKIGTSARAIGMGGAQVAVAEGVSSMAFNPAGIMVVGDYGFGATYTASLASIQHSFAGIVKNVPGLGAFGVSVILLTTDDIQETTPQYPEGTGRSFRASDYAFSVAFARQVTEQFRVGINGKIVQSYLFDREIGTSTFAFDIGTLYDIPILQSHLGVSLTNIGKDLKFINETYSLPTALRFGVLVDVMKDASNSLVTTLQIARINDSDEQYNWGTEYVFNNLVALRGGWKFAYDQENVTAGFGVRLNSLGLNSSVDYGYNNFKYLPGTHSFTFEMQF